MKPWERKLFEWGLLGYLVRDVIGADQEESFGIRQNHSMYLTDWHRLVAKHFVDHAYDVFVPKRGWGEYMMKRLCIWLDPNGSEWRAARLLGGTLAAICRKAGDPPATAAPPTPDRFESLLRCPDCHGGLARDAADTLVCAACGYQAALEGGVYNLLRSADRAELYPGDRQDIIDFSLPGHQERLLEGWSDLEGVFGNKFRWIGARASARLVRVHPGPAPARLRARERLRPGTAGHRRGGGQRGDPDAPHPPAPRTLCHRGRPSRRPRVPHRYRCLPHLGEPTRRRPHPHRQHQHDPADPRGITGTTGAPPSYFLNEVIPCANCFRTCYWPACCWRWPRAISKT
jgi:hypothetical protein